MRIYKDLYQVISESGRDLWEMGTVVDLKTMQNKNVEGDPLLGRTKELSPYDFKVMNPLEKTLEAYYFWKTGKQLAPKMSLSDITADPGGKQALINLDWCDVEFSERISEKMINPGEAWKLREEVWKELFSDELFMEDTFDYTYNERFLASNQLRNVIKHIKSNPTTRRATVNIWNGPEFMLLNGHTASDVDGLKKEKRVPCSLDYSWMIRDGKLNMFYHMRSSDYFEHFLNDVHLAAKMNLWMCSQLTFGDNRIENLVPGSLTMYVNSFHAYYKDLKERGIF